MLLKSFLQVQMNDKETEMTSTVQTFEPDKAYDFAMEVNERSGQNIFACYQCRRCASGCTVGEETGVTPDKLIRYIITGNKEAALDNKLVWQCVSCYTCGTRCPNLIQSGRITETLKKMTKEENVPPLIPNISYFHDSFVHGCTRWGRVNEMEFMGYYEIKHIFKNLKNLDFKSAYNEIKEQAKLGASMYKQKRLHLKLHTSKGRSEVKSLYKIALKKRGQRKQDLQ